MSEAITGAMIGTVGGLIVGLIIAHISYRLQRRLWQMQEAMRAYSSLFAKGDEALRLCNTVTAFRGNPEINMENLYDKYWSTASLAFRNELDQCWLLERDPGILEAIEDLRARFSDCSVGVLMRQLSPQAVPGTQRQASQDTMISDHDTARKIDDAFERLKELRKSVARRHFHHRREAEQP